MDLVKMAGHALSVAKALNVNVPRPLMGLFAKLTFAKITATMAVPRLDGLILTEFTIATVIAHPAPWGHAAKKTHAKICSAFTAAFAKLSKAEGKFAIAAFCTQGCNARFQLTKKKIRAKM